MCIDVNFILAYVTIGSKILCVSTNYTFATVYKGRHTKDMSVIDEPAQVAVQLQLNEMSSITIPNQQLQIFAQGTFFNKLFFRKILAILSICDKEKISMVIACTRNRFDFWNSCKHLQNFVNVEAIVEHSMNIHEGKG